MVYYDGELSCDIDEELLIEYIKRRNIIENTPVIKSAEVHATIVPYDDATTYIIRVRYENVKYGVLVEGFLDIDVKRFNKFLRSMKMKKFISSDQTSSL